jgi:hypothetical protein
MTEALKALLGEMEREVKVMGRSLASMVEDNAEDIVLTGHAIRKYAQRYQEGHITLDELLRVQNEFVGNLKVHKEAFVKAEKAYRNHDDSATKLRNFINSLE